MFSFKEHCFSSDSEIKIWIGVVVRPVSKEMRKKEKLENVENETKTVSEVWNTRLRMMKKRRIEERIYTANTLIKVKRKMSSCEERK